MPDSPGQLILEGPVEDGQEVPPGPVGLDLLALGGQVGAVVHWEELGAHGGVEVHHRVQNDGALKEKFRVSHVSIVFHV